MSRTAIVLALVLLVGQAYGAKYYVAAGAASASDSNAGTSPSAPWKTLAKVNASTFNPGDSILLRRGDTWNEPLIPPSSGSSGNPILVDAYWEATALSTVAPTHREITYMCMRQAIQRVTTARLRRSA